MATSFRGTTTWSSFLVLGMIATRDSRSTFPKPSEYTLTGVAIQYATPNRVQVRAPPIRVSSELLRAASFLHPLRGTEERHTVIVLFLLTNLHVNRGFLNLSLSMPSRKHSEITLWWWFAVDADHHLFRSAASLSFSLISAGVMLSADLYLNHALTTFKRATSSAGGNIPPGCSR
jgi:hypothetical protein